MKSHKLASAIPSHKGRACVYSRISNPNDLRDTSLETQEAATIAHMRGLGYTVDPEDVFRERQSGKDTDRPVLIEIKAMMRAGKYQAIGFYCLDRFVRSQVHTAILFDELEKLGVKPVSATNDIGDDTPEGHLILAIRAYLAESERIKIAERMNRGKRGLTEKGEYLKLGITKIGYVWDKATKRRTAKPDDAAIIQLIFHECAAGTSYSKMARTLNERGEPGPSLRDQRRKVKRSGAWTSSQIRQIIIDPSYKGWTVSNRYRKETVFDAEKNRKQVNIIKVPQEEWLVLDREGIITEALVDAGTWEQANRAAAMRVNNRASQRRPDVRAKHLLRGIVVCGVCGHKMYPHRTHSSKRDKDGVPLPTRYYYLCQTRSRPWQLQRPEVPVCKEPMTQAGPLDAKAWDLFKEAIFTPGVLEESLARLAALSDDVAGLESELASARSVLEAKERTRNTLYQKWRREQDDPDGDPEFRDRLEADYRAMRPILEGHRQAVREAEIRLASTAASPDIAETFRAKFEQLREHIQVNDVTTFEDRWEVLRLAGAVVVATPKAIILYLDPFGVGTQSPVKVFGENGGDGAGSVGAKPDATSGGSIRFNTMLLVGQIFDEALV